MASKKEIKENLELDGKLNPLTEQKTIGHAGKRIGVGRRLNYEDDE